MESHVVSHDWLRCQQLLSQLLRSVCGGCGKKQLSSKPKGGGSNEGEGHAFDWLSLFAVINSCMTVCEEENSLLNNVVRGIRLGKT